MSTGGGENTSWEPGRYWRVAYGPDLTGVWCETSDEVEARTMLARCPDGVLLQLFERHDREWRRVAQPVPGGFLVIMAEREGSYRCNEPGCNWIADPLDHARDVHGITDLGCINVVHPDDHDPLPDDQ